MIKVWPRVEKSFLPWMKEVLWEADKWDALGRVTWLRTTDHIRP
jgi:hypothetical protein